MAFESKIVQLMWVAAISPQLVDQAPTQMFQVQASLFALSPRVDLCA
jgi:hypothetical protein